MSSPVTHIISPPVLANNFLPSSAKLPPLEIRFLPGELPPSDFNLARLEDWELAVILFPKRDHDYGEFYTLDDIGPAFSCLGSRDALYYWARRLWPNYEGKYSLTLLEAIRLLRFYRRSGQRKLTRDELIQRIEERR